MPEVKFYEFALIRIVPRVERGEFLNVGVILFSKSAKFLKTKIFLNEAKLNCFDHQLNLSELHAYLNAFERICEGDHSRTPIGAEDQASRFRWLTAVRSSSIQTSRPHGGASFDLDQTLDHLFDDLVR